MQLNRRQQLICSFRGRMKLAAEAAAAEEAAAREDPWAAPLGQLLGTVHPGGTATITSQQCLDALQVPMCARTSAVCRRLNRLMQEHGWEPVRISLGSDNNRVRGFRRQTHTHAADVGRWLGAGPHQAERH